MLERGGGHVCEILHEILHYHHDQLCYKHTTIMNNTNTQNIVSPPLSHPLCLPYIVPFPHCPTPHIPPPAHTETLLHGVAPHRPLQQRVLILQVFRSWSAETDKLQFLFETYDMRPVGERSLCVLFVG